MRIRPIAESDLGELQALSRETGVGFTSLPDNREFEPLTELPPAPWGHE